MTIQSVRRRDFAVAGCATLALMLAACGEGRKPECQAARDVFTADFVSAQGTGTCADREGGLFVLHTYYYSLPEGGSDYTKPGSIGILPLEYGTRIGLGHANLDMANEPNAVGDFSEATANSEDLCTVPSFTVSGQQYAAEAGEPDLDSTYEWANVSVLVTATAIGTQFSGTLTYSDTVAGCSATYEVWALVGQNSCTTDAECDENVNINPDFLVRCDIELGQDLDLDPGEGYCVTAQKPPSRK